MSDALFFTIFLPVALSYLFTFIIYPLLLMLEHNEKSSKLDLILYNVYATYSIRYVLIYSRKTTVRSSVCDMVFLWTM